MRSRVVLQVHGGGEKPNSSLWQFSEAKEGGTEIAGVQMRVRGRGALFRCRRPSRTTQFGRS